MCTLLYSSDTKRLLTLADTKKPVISSSHKTARFKASEELHPPLQRDSKSTLQRC
jgi:hypothetical protein